MSFPQDVKNLFVGRRIEKIEAEITRLQAELLALEKQIDALLEHMDVQADFPSSRIKVR